MIDIKGIIDSTLKIPVIELFEPILPPCATWYLFDESVGLSGDGKEEETLENYQIDIWERNRDMLKIRGRRLKTELMLSGVPISIPDLSYQYDSNGKIWRAILKFSELRKE